MNEQAMDTYECDICSETYAYASTLRRHKREKHSDVKSLFPCETCDKQFPRRDNGQRHVGSAGRIHRNRWPC